MILLTSGFNKHPIPLDSDARLKGKGSTSTDKYKALKPIQDLHTFVWP